MKSFVRDVVFFENDFEKRCYFSNKLNSSITRDEIIPLYIEYLETKLDRYKKQGYMPFAQIIINTKRYIEWLDKQLPIEGRTLDSSKLKVNCSIAAFGHIINELLFRNYVEAAKSKDNEINYSATARIIQKSFLLVQKDGTTEVSFNHLADEIRNSKLSEEHKKAIMLPPNR